jgi:hypothetical protein
MFLEIENQIINISLIVSAKPSSSFGEGYTELRVVTGETHFVAKPYEELKVILVGEKMPK